MKSNPFYKKANRLVIIAMFLIASLHSYSQYLPLAGGTMTGNLSLNSGLQIQTPYLGFNAPFTQPVTSGNVALFPNNSTGSLDIVGWGAGWRFIPSNTSTYSAPVVTIDNSGNTNVAGNIFVGQNLGIGTTTPAGKMDIFNNSNNATNLVLSANYNSSYRWRFNTIDRGNAIDMDITASNNLDAQQTILTLSPTYSGRPSLALEGNWLVANNGNIGIGTTDNTTWQLATSPYKLAVAGSAIATSVTVKSYANWPDYVFKKSYHLPSLTNIKKYIDQNHHLPEIPSATQIAKDGLNLGEMNTLLLKKVEELTLYTIAADKKANDGAVVVAQQQTQLIAQQKQIDRLNEQVQALINSSKK